MNTPSKGPGFSDEDRFILLCSRTDLEEEQIKLGQSLAGIKLDWNYIFRRAQKNYVSPLIYQNLNLFNRLIPNGIIEKFKRAYLAYRFQNELRYEDLEKVLNAFNQEKIPALLHKGAALGVIVYRDIAFRWMNDIDLLVNETDWPRIVNIVSGLDFTFEYPTADRGRVWPHLIGHHNHIRCVSKRNTLLEFKFSLFLLDFPKFETESLWKEAKNITLRGVSVFIPSPEDHLLILSLGLFQHNYRGLIWFCDIAEFLRRYAGVINWQGLIKKSKEKRLSVLLYYCLLFTAELLDIKIPADVLRKLKPNYPQRKLFQCFNNLDTIINFKNDRRESRRIPESELLKLFLLNKLTFKPKPLMNIIRYFLGYIFPPAEFITYCYAIPKNSPKIYLGYLRRLWRLASFSFRAVKKIF